MSYTGNVQRLIDVTFEEQVPVIVSGLGNPAGIIERTHREGVVVMSLCGNVKQARKLKASGIDVIIAQGHEAGGHTGRIGTMRWCRKSQTRSAYRSSPPVASPTAADCSPP